MSEIVTFYDLQKKNLRKTIFLIFFFLILAGIIGFLVDSYFLGFPYRTGFPIATFLALLISGTQSLVSYFKGDKIVLYSVKARPANPEVFEEKKLINIVEEMKIASGLPMPKVYIVDTDVPNAFATGRDPEHSSVAVTRGLMKLLNREELQGVIGHEMAHIRNRDILTMTIAATLLGIVVLLSDMALRNLWWGGGRRRKRGKGSGNAVILILLLALAILAPLIARLVFLSISRSREYLADAGSVEFTRNPTALAKALEKLALKQTGKPIANKAISHMCIVSPLRSSLMEKENLWADLWSTHPPIQKRIWYLKKMAHAL